jgi:hypothetical protein
MYYRDDIYFIYMQKKLAIDIKYLFIANKAREDLMLYHL